MNYADWMLTVPLDIRQDSLWAQEACRPALFAADLCWNDATKLFRDGRTLSLAAQLIEAVGSIGANLSEGYSRGYQKDRARFYEYALGSARESRTWNFNGRQVLGKTRTQHRLRLHTQIIRLLLSMVPATRGYTLHEGDPSSALLMTDSDRLPNEVPASLLDEVPMPEP
jgi:four helix bundle protein